jgi:hypothetical protein
MIRLTRLIVPDRALVTPRRRIVRVPLPCYSFRRRQWGFLEQSPDGLLWHANVFMNEAKESIVDRTVDLSADTVKVLLATATYVANADEQFIDEAGADDMIDGRAAGTTDQTLASKVFGKDLTGDFAYLDAADVTFVGVAAGPAITQVGLYKDTGTPTTSKIISVFDIADITPNGGDITIQWATPANGGVLKFA